MARGEPILLCLFAHRPSLLRLASIRLTSRTSLSVPTAAPRRLGRHLRRGRHRRLQIVTDLAWQQCLAPPPPPDSRPYGQRRTADYREGEVRRLDSCCTYRSPTVPHIRCHRGIRYLALAYVSTHVHATRHVCSPSCVKAKSAIVHPRSLILCATRGFFSKSQYRRRYPPPPAPVILPPNAPARRAWS